MSDRITKVFEHDDFAIWHVPQANGYVYEAAGIAVDADSYADCPFESTYDDALNAACELYDVEVGSLSTPFSQWMNTDSDQNRYNFRFRHYKDTGLNALMVDGHVEAFQYKKGRNANDPNITTLKRKNIYVNRTKFP